MIVTGSSFRANQSRYVGAAYRGEDVVVKTRIGCFKVVPVPSFETEEEYNVVEEFRGSVMEAKEAFEGKRKLRSAEQLSDELHAINN